MELEEEEDEETTNMELEVGVRITRAIGNITFTSTESDTVFILLAHLPGFKKDEIEVSISETRSEISVSGGGQIESLDIVNVWKQLSIGREVDIEGFNEVVQIPNGVILEQVEARFDEEDAILIISMPKWRSEDVSIEQIHEEESTDYKEEEVTSERDTEENTESKKSEPFDGDTKPNHAEIEEMEQPSPGPPPLSSELIVLDQDGDQLLAATPDSKEDEEKLKDEIPTVELSDQLQPTVEIPDQLESEGDLEKKEIPMPDIPDRQDHEGKLEEEIPEENFEEQILTIEIPHPLEPEEKLGGGIPTVGIPHPLEPEETVEQPDHIEPEEKINEGIPTVEVPHYVETKEKLQEEEVPSVRIPDHLESEEKITEEIPKVEIPDYVEPKEKIDEPAEYLEEEKDVVRIPDHLEPGEQLEHEKIPTVDISEQLEPKEKLEEETPSVDIPGHLEDEDKLVEEEIPSVDYPDYLEPAKQFKDDEIPTIEIPDQSPKLIKPIELEQPNPLKIADLHEEQAPDEEISASKTPDQDQRPEVEKLHDPKAVEGENLSSEPHDPIPEPLGLGQTPQQYSDIGSVGDQEEKEPETSQKGDPEKPNQSFKEEDKRPTNEAKDEKLPESINLPKEREDQEQESASSTESDQDLKQEDEKFTDEAEDQEPEPQPQPTKSVDLPNRDTYITPLKEQKDHKQEIDQVTESNQNHKQEDEKPTIEADDQVPETSKLIDLNQIKEKEDQDHLPARSKDPDHNLKHDDEDTKTKTPELTPMTLLDLDSIKDREEQGYESPSEIELSGEIKEENLDGERGMGKRMKRGARRTSPFPLNSTCLLAGSAFIFSVVVLVFHFLRDRKRK